MWRAWLCCWFLFLSCEKLWLVHLKWVVSMALALSARGTPACLPLSRMGVVLDCSADACFSESKSYGILSHCCDSSLPWYSAGTVCVPVSATRLPPVPRLKFQIKESGKIFTCSAGDGGGACRSLEVMGMCLTGWNFMSLPCHISVLVFKSFPVQAISVGNYQLSDCCWHNNFFCAWDQIETEFKKSADSSPCEHSIL